MKILENLLYTSDHEWLKVDGNTALFGITDYAQHALGEIVYVELPEEDDELEVGENCFAIESVKAATDIASSVDGMVLEVNEELENSPENINNSPYDSWVVKIQLTDLSQLDKFMNAAAYKEFCEKED